MEEGRGGGLLCCVKEENRRGADALTEKRGIKLML